MAIQNKVDRRSGPRSTDTTPMLIPAIVLLLSMGACAAIPPQDPPMALAQCHVEGARWALGRTPEGDLIERARLESGTATAHAIHPGGALDLDIRSDRLNPTVNARNATDGVKCG